MITGFIGPTPALPSSSPFPGIPAGRDHRQRRGGTGNWGNLMATFGVVDWGSTFNNLGPGVLPLVF